jgi:hypothetical protein
MLRIEAGQGKRRTMHCNGWGPPHIWRIGYAGEIDRMGEDGCK